ncbi:MAG: UPF0149 family protein [Candidatus Competibacteraceae bacterium]|jgi:uncharacterized protein YgfB (UPF0149 family)|nr:UPF0149 family protein [Candidatus Competibacteraceae bacterium]
MIDLINLPDFELLGKHLQSSDPAETHGTLCGMLCVEPTLNGTIWLERIISDLFADAPSTPVQDDLLALYSATVAQLQADEYTFTLCLPDDESTLTQRATALTHWCQGFLSGLGAQGVMIQQGRTDEVEEFIKDVFMITQGMRCETDSANDQEEQAYCEIVEYVRVGVLLVYQELTDQPTHPTHWH